MNHQSQDQGPSLCPSCGGFGDYGPHFPCSSCLGGGYYLSPDGQYLSLYPKPGYKGPFYQFPLQGTGGDQ
jgi:DnaJ-class molecular chaperone